MARKKEVYWEYIGGFVDGMVTKPAKGLTKSLKEARRVKVKGTRLKKKLFAKKKRCKLW